MLNPKVLALGGVAVAAAIVLAATSCEGGSSGDEELASQKRMRPGITAPPKIYKTNKNQKAKITGSGTIRTDSINQRHAANHQRHAAGRTRAARAPGSRPGGHAG